MSMCAYQFSSSYEAAGCLTATSFVVLLFPERGTVALCAMGVEVAKERVSVVISATMPEGKLDSAIYNPVHPTAKVFQAQASPPKKKTTVLPSSSERRHRR
eukprot:scpid112072/ scgid4653/ 